MIVDSRQFYQGSGNIYSVFIVVKDFLRMQASLLLREKKLVKIGGLSTEEYFNEYRPRTDAYLFEKDLLHEKKAQSRTATDTANFKGEILRFHLAFFDVL